MASKDLVQLKEDVNERLKRRTDECERLINVSPEIPVYLLCYRLKDDLKAQSDELVSLRSRYRENQNLLADSQSQLIPLQFQLAKSQREIDSLKTQVSDLENDLSVTNQANALLRREAANKQFELDSAAAVSSAAAEEQDRKIKSLQVCFRSI